MADDKPHPPSELKIEGKRDQGTGNPVSTHKKDSVTISGKIDPRPGGTPGDKGPVPPGRRVRLVVELSRTAEFKHSRVKDTGYGDSRRAEVTFNNLEEDTRYWIRAYSDPRTGKRSGPNGSSFWTERRPEAPTLENPVENVVVNEGADITFRWKHTDADSSPKDPQSRAQLRWRVPRTSVDPPGEWDTRSIDSNSETRTVAANEFRGYTFYEWQVRTKDNHSSLWSPWSSIRSFFVLGTNQPPRLHYPIRNEAVPVDTDIVFQWDFRDPTGDRQEKADLRYRAEGATDWTEVPGDLNTPGAAEEWNSNDPLVPLGAFQAGFRYEWQVRTYDDSGAGDPSDWSESGFFRSILTPGWQARDIELVGPPSVLGELGHGEYKVTAYDRGGVRSRGVITDVTRLQWGRIRDDISNCLFTVSGFGNDCGLLLGELRTWAHEIVLFRNGERVWEGPITRIGDHTDSVEIEAQDPMVYVKRRIMRQGYNDRVRITKRDKQTGEVLRQTKPRSVVDRAAILISNALAPDDPNVLGWLSRFDFTNDAKQGRAVADWSKLTWEEVDDLAANAGLDYTCVGRRIILWDTHRSIGRLPEMRNGTFFENPVVTEYGMSAANVFGVTNNNGLYGFVELRHSDRAGLGPIEMLASEYSESDTGGAAPETLTNEARSDKEERLKDQAARNIHGRWPPPLVVRIPDNSRLRPDANVGINQLIPGVHIPLRATTRIREVSQIQKLDRVEVRVENGEESVHLTMSPAPDPDSLIEEGTVEE